MKKNWKHLLLTGCAVCLMAGCGGQAEAAASQPAAVRAESREETKEQTAAETTEQTPAETQGETAAESQENVQAEPQEQAEESQSAQLKDVAAMVGMKDEETADLFGGGEETGQRINPSILEEITRLIYMGIRIRYLPPAGRTKR